MEKKGYTFEAEYIRAFVNWHRACDERELSQLQRCRYNYQLMQYLLDDLIPRHQQQYDLSLLEVNRYDKFIDVLTNFMNVFAACLQGSPWCQRPNSWDSHNTHNQHREQGMETKRCEWRHAT